MTHRIDTNLTSRLPGGGVRLSARGSRSGGRGHEDSRSCDPALPAGGTFLVIIDDDMIKLEVN